MRRQPEYPQDVAELIHALRGIMPQPIAPRLTASTPAACGEFIRQWGEYAQLCTAADGGMTMQGCMDESTLAAVCYLGDFPTHRVPSISDADLLECLRSVVRPCSSISEVAMHSRLQVAAAGVPPPINANDVHRHAIATWEATRTAVTEANCWSLFTDTGTMYGTWISASGKSFSKVFVEALRPHPFRQSVRDELIINDTPMENPERFCRRVIHLAAQWPEIQRVVDAAVADSYRYSRGGRGRVTEDRGGEVMSQIYQSGRGHSASFKRWETANNYNGGARSDQLPAYGGMKERVERVQPLHFEYGEYDGYVRRKPERDFSRGTKAYKPEKRADYVPAVGFRGLRDVSSRRAVSAVTRVRSRSMDPRVSRMNFDAPKKASSVVAAPVLLVSPAEHVVTTAVSVPTLVEGEPAVEGNESVQCSKADSDFATSSDMVVEGKLIEGKEAAPTYCCTVDECEHIELVEAEEVVDERGKSTSTILKAENPSQGRGLVAGLLFPWVLSAAVCLLIGTTVLPKSNRSAAALDFRQLDEAIPKTEFTLALSRKIVSNSEIRGLQEYEHMAAGGDEKQYRITAIEAGDWAIVSIIAANKITKAMEMYWRAATALGPRVWDIVGAWHVGGASKGEWTASAQGCQLPVTGIG